MVPTPYLAFNKVVFRARFDPLASGWNVSSIFPWKLHYWTEFDPPVACYYISTIFLGMSGYCFQAGSFLLIVEMTQLGPLLSTKLLSEDATTEEWVYFLLICMKPIMLMIVEVNTYKSSFLRWFSLINNIYIHYHTHLWDCGLQIWERKQSHVLWAQLSIQ